MLQLFKKREAFNHRQNKEKNSYKLEQSQHQLDKLKKEEVELQTKIEKTEKLAKEQSEDKIVKLRAALRPLEEAKNEIEQCMQVYLSRMTICEQAKERKEQ